MPRTCLGWMGVEEAYMQLRSLHLLPAINYGRKSEEQWQTGKLKLQCYSPDGLVAKSDDLSFRYEVGELSTFLGIAWGTRMRCSPSKELKLEPSRRGGQGYRKLGTVKSIEQSK